MAVQRSIQMQRVIAGQVIETSEVCFVTDDNYITDGEYVVITKTNRNITVNLDHTKNDHLIIKSLTNTKIIPIQGKIDEEYSEINLNKGSSIELFFSFGNWYILSSDGIKEQ